MPLNHLVFLDESGDHSMQHIDRQFPVFALAATIFNVDYYLDTANPLIDRVKYKYWGHRNVIFHSVDIRKQKGDFSILREPEKRQNFLEDINKLIDNLDFKIISSGINKLDHLQQYHTPQSPYDLTLEFIMERLYYFFRNTKNRCLLIAEARGEKENAELYRVFRNLIQNGNDNLSASQFQAHISDLKFYPKHNNENGNQISDLVVYPVARKIISKAAGFEPYQRIKPKFYARSNGDFWGYGLKAFPHTTNTRVRNEDD
ncbi:DUF3800 domain-containing protein [Cohnella sp.]|uniref:DUF3800 domain-containing protein n=1 Tax=Cohnella sp. TaxID=1883426 RepID=UPI00257E49F7|nr:DUF3800 domain-containing protein [Cohnella sp.]